MLDFRSSAKKLNLPPVAAEVVVSLVRVVGGDVTAVAVVAAADGGTADVGAADGGAADGGSADGGAADGGAGVVAAEELKTGFVTSVAVTASEEVILIRTKNSTWI